ECIRIYIARQPAPARAGSVALDMDAERAYTHHMEDIATLALKMKNNCPAMRVRQAGRMLARVYDEAFRPMGIELSQLPVLGAAAMKGDAGLSVTDLARFLVMDRTTVTRAIRPLEKAGLLHVARSLDDARSKIVIITRAGEKTLRAVYPAWERTTKRVREVF